MTNTELADMLQEHYSLLNQFANAQVDQELRRSLYDRASRALKVSQKLRHGELNVSTS